jgi:hypothetical protein
MPPSSRILHGFLVPWKLVIRKGAFMSVAGKILLSWKKYGLHSLISLPIFCSPSYTLTVFCVQNQLLLFNGEKLNKVLKDWTKLIRKRTKSLEKDYNILCCLTCIRKYWGRMVVGKDFLNCIKYSYRWMLALWSGSSRTYHVSGQKSGKTQVQSGPEPDI